MTSLMEFKVTTQPMPDIPKPPEGEGWMLGSSVVEPEAAMRLSPIPWVFHYWQRPKSHEAKVCQNCPSMAFVEGKCLGCGTALES